MITGITMAAVISLVLYHITFDYPEFRVPLMAGLIFTGMFLSRVFVIGPLGFVTGFFTALMQTTADSAPDTEALVRGTLYLWISIVYPAVLTILMNQILLPANPWEALVRALNRRLDTATIGLERILKEGQAGGRTDPALLELATRGSSPLLALLNFAEAKDPLLKRRHESLFSVICASEHLLHASASLSFREPWKLSAEDAECARVLLAEIAEIRAALPQRQPGLGPKKSDPTPADLPQLRELQFAADSFRDGLIRYITEETASAATARRPLFVPDAFSNPSHLRFALKVTLAAMTCYVIYNGLGWPGISTAFVTCCFIALENTEATIRKGWLRLIGCATGGFFGYLAIILLIPHMESITSLVLLTVAWSMFAGWIAAGTDRISYGGLQAALAFFLCIFQGYAPDFNLTIVRDRLIGIILGIIVSVIVYRYIWPEHAIDGLRASLARVLRSLADALRLPTLDGDLADEKKTAVAIHRHVTLDVDNTLRLSELAVIENVPGPGQKHITTSMLEHLTSHTQALSLMMTALFAKTKLAEWQRLDRPVQAAELALRLRASQQLHRLAGLVETGQPLPPCDVADTYAAWNQAAHQATGNDRPRLVRRIIAQIKQLSSAM
jgi:multidrug resistance protein MdtO